MKNTDNNSNTTRVALFTLKDSNGNTLSLFEDTPTATLNGKPYTKTVQPRRKTKKAEDGTPLVLLHFEACYCNQDGKTISFSNVPAEAQSLLASRYNKTTSQPVTGKWEKATATSPRQSKGKAKPFLYSVDTALAEPCVFDWHIAEFHIMREKATMRTEDDTKPLTLAKYSKAIKEAEALLAQAHEAYNTALARHSEAKNLTAEEWAEYVERVVTEQNNHSQALNPSLAPKKTPAEKKAEAVKMQKVAEAVKRGDLAEAQRLLAE